MQVQSPDAEELGGMALTIAFTVRDAGPVRELVLGLDGELDTESSRILERRLADLPDADVVVIEMSGLSFLDSTGLRLMVTEKRRRGDALRLVGARPPVTNVFEVSGAAELLEQR